jgi:hypothetical protein
VRLSRTSTPVARRCAKIIEQRLRIAILRFRLDADVIRGAIDAILLIVVLAFQLVEIDSRRGTRPTCSRS